MKKTLLIIAILISTSTVFANIDTIRNVGFRFTPNNITINVGDTITWIIASNHNVVEVDSSVWVANGATSNSGFSQPFGGGTQVFPVAGTYYYVCAPHAGQSMKGTINVLPNTTSIAEEKMANNFSFYPNPAIQQLTVEIPDAANYKQLEIANELGQTVYSQQLISGTEIIDISRFKSGIYFINLKSDRGILTRKLIVE